MVCWLPATTSDALRQQQQKQQQQQQQQPQSGRSIAGGEWFWARSGSEFATLWGATHNKQRGQKAAKRTSLEQLEKHAEKCI